MTGPCVVLGAGGRVGRLLRGAWPSTAGAAPVVYQSRVESAGIDIVAPLDVTISDWFSGPVGSVLVLSGATRGTASELAENTECALTGLEFATQIKARRVFICSSAAVYRAQRDHAPFGETDTTSPDRPYGQAKLAMEAAVAHWCAQTQADIQVICLRMANVIGADQLAQSARQASAEAPLMLDRFSDGRSPRRSFLSPATFAGAIQAFSQLPATRGFDIINLADSGPAVSMSDILRALRECGHDIPWDWKPAPDTAIPEVALDTTRLRAWLPDCAELAGTTSGAALVKGWLDATGGRL